MTYRNPRDIEAAHEESEDFVSLLLCALWSPTVLTLIHRSSKLLKLPVHFVISGFPMIYSGRTSSPLRVSNRTAG